MLGGVVFAGLPFAQKGGLILVHVFFLWFTSFSSDLNVCTSGAGTA